MFARSVTGAVGNDGKLETNFIYDEARPFEVRLQNVKGDDVVFDRDLLAMAFANPDKTAGLGQVRFLVAGDDLFMSLVFTSYIYTVIFPQEPVEDFLTESFDLVPFGTESMDVDALLNDFYNDKI